MQIKNSREEYQTRAHKAGLVKSSDRSKSSSPSPATSEKKYHIDAKGQVHWEKNN